MHKLAADPTVTRMLMERLVKAFEEFATEQAALTDEGLRFIDALMGFHNAYKQILLDLESRNPDCPPGWFRQVAINTMRQTLSPPDPRR